MSHKMADLIIYFGLIILGINLGIVAAQHFATDNTKVFVECNEPVVQYMQTTFVAPRITMQYETIKNLLPSTR